MSETKTVYIAGPMSGLPEFNYPAFDAAEVSLKERGYLTLNPTALEIENTDTAYQQKPWDWYLRRAIRMVTEADGMALLPGWENSKGATLERTIALALGLDVRRLRDWMRT